jgi:hypothetical protein
VTSTGASLFWAAAGKANDIAAAIALKNRSVTRRLAVILPRPAVAG